MLSPHDIARAYDRSIAALWREDTAVAASFTAWLARFWVSDAPAEPADYPDSVSFLGGAGRGIRWYVADGVILGYMRGSHGGCYRVPVTTTLPVGPSVRFSAMPRDTTGVATVSQSTPD